MFVTESL